MYTMKRLSVVAALAVAIFAALFAGSAIAAEQRAFGPEDGVTMYEKPDKASKQWHAILPPAGAAVPSAVRDKSGGLWFKTTVGGRTGWLHYVGIRLVMGPKSKFAAGAVKRLEALLGAILTGKEKNWEDIGASEGSDRTFTRGGGEINTISTPGGLRASQFHGTGGKACSQLLGFDPIGMKMDALRSKIGTPTVRETPEGRPDVTILTYEADGGDKNLEITFESGAVKRISIY